MRREFPASSARERAAGVNFMRQCRRFMKAPMNLPPKRLTTLQRNLLDWYRANRRDLPWRRDRDPYRIWLAEIMLQQTRIAAVLPYYENFLARFPTLDVLARARESEVLKLWAGLGYYSRARNLHRAARKIVAEHRGQFPQEPKAALALPGIGEYTAAAILSIAFDTPLAALDGNVARVLARLFAIRGDLRAPKKWQRLTKIAEQLLPANSTSDWNQALMELGETICTPRSPQCAHCPITSHCEARALNITHKLPAPRRKRKIVRLQISAAILVDPQHRTILTKLPGAHDSAIFSGLWQFPAIASASRNGHSAAELSAYLRSSLDLPPCSLESLPPVAHTVTYRQITIVPFLARVNTLPRLPECRVLTLDKLSSLAVSSATKKIARAALHAFEEMSQ
jgi:A/G-specific adenine glycosylase